MPQLFQELSDLEVTHIIVPSYKMGRLKKLVSKTFDDTKYATLVSKMHDYRLYRVQGAPKIIKICQPAILNPNEDQCPLSDAQKENGS